MKKISILTDRSNLLILTKIFIFFLFIFGFSIHVQAQKVGGSASYDFNTKVVPVPTFGAQDGKNLIQFFKDILYYEDPEGDTDYLNPSSGIGNQIIGIGGGEDFSGNCTDVVGNEKIICAALQYTGIRYANKNGGKDWAQVYGVSQNDLGNLGHPAAQWKASRIPGGKGDFLECSGYTDLAIYEAFKIDKVHCSARYLDDKSLFREVSIYELMPGDFLIKSRTCGDGGHVGIYVSTEPDGRLLTLESSAGKNITDNTVTSGYYKRKATEYPYAVRYIGPGSTEKLNETN